MRRLTSLAPWVGAFGLAAAPAAAQAPFTEEALSRGLVYVTEGNSPAGGAGAGLALADLDNDGDPDAVCMARLDGIIGIFENDGTGQFTERTGTGIYPLLGMSGVLAFDFDGDRDLDVFITNEGTSNVMFRNEGDFVFTDVTGDCGLVDFGPAYGASAGDVDGDGWIDLSVSGYGSPNLFYMNQGGAFVDRAAQMGLDDSWRTIQTVLFDVDWDGDLDLYYSTDKRYIQETDKRNQLYENRGNGTFVDISAESGSDVNIYSMGVAVGDFDGNGFQDLYPTNTGLEPNPLLMNQGDLTFVDEYEIARVGSFRTGWGAVFFDYDNDTHQDLYVCNIQTHSFSPQNRLFENDGSYPCSDVGPALGVDDYFQSYCIAMADVDLDGDLDLLTQNFGTNVRLFINHEGTSRNWVQFVVEGEAPNWFGLGADVRVRAGAKWQRQQLMAGGNGYKGQNEYVLHFGLDDAKTVDEAIVRWPDGRQRRLRDLDVNRRYTVSPAKNVRAPELRPAF